MSRCLLVLLATSISSVSAQASGSFPAYAVNLESWPAIWNTTACRDSISAPAQCAELNPGFELAGEIDNQNNVDNRFLHAPNHAEGTHGGCDYAGNLMHGPNQECGQAVFRFYCHDEAVVRFSAEGMAGSVAYRGNDDSFWTWQDEFLNRMHFASPFRSASEWRIGQMGNGFHARVGAHTVVLSEREDGAKVRAISMVAGYPACHFGQPDSDRTAIPALERHLAAVASTMNAADDSMERTVSQMQAQMSTSVEQMSTNQAAASTHVSTMQAASAAETSSLRAQLSTAQSQLTDLQALVSSVTAKLSQPVPAFAIEPGRPDNGEPPSVEAMGSDVIITAPSGGVKISSRDCATVDVCALGRQIEAVTSQLNSPL